MSMDFGHDEANQDWPDFLKDLCDCFTKRHPAQSPRREDLAVEFFSGALKTLIMLDHPFAKPLSAWIVLILVNRGTEAFPK